MTETVQVPREAMVRYEKLFDHLFTACCLHCAGVDGGDLQELLEEAGVIVATEQDEPCSDDCNCAGLADFPTFCYRRAAAPQATDPRERHILVTPDRSHVEVRDMDHAMTLLAEQNIAIENLLATDPRDPAPDATDWKPRCEAAEKHAGAQADYILLLRDENEKLREALTLSEKNLNGLRDDLIDNKDADDLTVATMIEQIAAAIRAALSPPPLSPEAAGYAQAIRREAIEATRKKAAEASIRALLAQTEGK